MLSNGRTGEKSPAQCTHQFIQSGCRGSPCADSAGPCGHGARVLMRGTGGFTTTYFTVTVTFVMDERIEGGALGADLAGGPETLSGKGDLRTEQDPTGRRGGPCRQRETGPGGCPLGRAVSLPAAGWRGARGQDQDPAGSSATSASTGLVSPDDHSQVQRTHCMHLVSAPWRNTQEVVKVLPSAEAP